MAVVVGFEPTDGSSPSTVFKTVTFDLSVTLPGLASLLYLKLAKHLNLIRPAGLDALSHLNYLTWSPTPTHKSSRLILQVAILD